MNIQQYSGLNILDAQNRNRDDLRKAGTSIQAILPVQSNGKNEGEGATSAAETDTASPFESLVSTAIDTVNPLQHIPGISTAYQEATGDTMNPVASMAGGFLFGGPVGLIAGAASSFLEMLTGKTAGQHAQAFLSGNANKDTAQQQFLAQLGDGSTMIQRQQSVSLQDYQAFAAVQDNQQRGTGADPSTVAWSANVLTAQSLKQVANLYDTNQNNNNSLSNRAQRPG